MIGVMFFFLMAHGSLEEAMGKTSREISLPTQAQGWKWDGKEKAYDPKTIFDYINGAGELYRAYGFRKVWVRQYVKGNKPPITVEIYDMGSAERAYGVFSFDRQDEEVGIGQGSEFGGGLLRFWKGKYLVSIYSEGDSPEVTAAVLKLGKEVAKRIPSEGSPPRILNFLPGAEFGLQARSVRVLPNHILLNKWFFVASENILGLGSNTEIALAPYQRGSKKVNLLLIRYPTTREAELGWQGFKKAYMPDAGAKDRIKTEDRQWTLGRQAENFIYIVFGAASEADGDELLMATEKKVHGREGKWKEK